MANLVKRSYFVLDLSKLTGAEDGWFDVTKRCCLQAGRPPPLPPAKFATILEGKSFTSKKADLGTVSSLYAQAFEARMGHAASLRFDELGWTDAELLALLEAIGGLAELKSLSLYANQITDK